MRARCSFANTVVLSLLFSRPMEGDLLKIASEQPNKLDLSVKLAFTTSPVTYGGPVATDEFTILHGFGEVEGSQKLCPGVYVGGSEELIDAVRLSDLDAQNALFIKGRSSWVPGQLKSELSKGVWIVAAVSSSMILRYAGAPCDEQSTNGENLWSDILRCMGGKFADIAKDYTKSGDRKKTP
jgi:putative transcriptional regulator